MTISAERARKYEQWARSLSDDGLTNVLSRAQRKAWTKSQKAAVYAEQVRRGEST